MANKAVMLSAAHTAIAPGLLHIGQYHVDFQGVGDFISAAWLTQVYRYYMYAVCVWPNDKAELA
jgi:hypothetical protein